MQKYSCLDGCDFKRGWFLHKKKLFGWSKVSKVEEHRLNKLNDWLRVGNEKKAIAVLHPSTFRKKVKEIWGSTYLNISSL